MSWSSVWPSRWFPVQNVSARRFLSTAKLTVELLEDRLVPSTMTYDVWRQQTFTVDDAAVSAVLAPIGPTVTALTPQNASFGSLIGLPSAFGSTPYRGDGYNVAIIDTGIDYKNVNLGGGFGAGYRVVAGWDFVNKDADPMDDNGHGTHVAGIIGSSSTTYSGVAPNVNLIALKVLDKNGSGTYANVEAALQWVVANQAKYHIEAVNLSLGSGNYTTNPYTFLDDELAAITSKGVFVSVAAGNSFYENKSAPGLDYPAIDPYVVSVGAVYTGDFGALAWGSGARDNTTAADRIASFSQRSTALGIMAPGAMITSTYLNNTMQTMAGTSMAAPVVAGAAILIHQALDAKGAAASESIILGIMKSTGVSIKDGDDENDNVTNTGLTFKRLDVGAALASLGKPINTAPVVQTIANQTVAPGATHAITLNATDAEGNPITFTASVVNAPGSQAYQLRQQLGLTFGGSYFTNQWGQNEKWITSTGGTWYCILPNGELRRFAGTMASTLLAGNLLANVGAAAYADPSRLWNASSVAGPTLTVVGNQLTIQASANVAAGSYQIQVTASDGKLASARSFTVTVQGNTAPQIAAIANRSMLTTRTLAIAVVATDAQNDPVTFSASIVGSFSSRPAILVLVGNQLTIHSAPDFIGGFDIQVSASDGALSTAFTFHVNVTAAPVAYRFNEDFNGDGILDVGTINKDGSRWFSLMNADGTFRNQNWGAWSATSAFRTLQTGDFNGDGKTDLLGFSTGGNVWVGLSTGTTFRTTRWAIWSAASAWTLLQVGDFNGDGKSDFAAYSTAGKVMVGISTGANFTSTLWGKFGTPTIWATLTFADVNGDGKLDLVGKSKLGQWYVAYSTGTTFQISAHEPLAA